MFYISVLYPEASRRIVQIPEEGLLIGRNFGCDLQLEDEFVSARHSRIYFENGNVFIEDLGSTNGTFVNSEQVEKQILEPGQNIQVGVTVIKYG
jgi:pSer/pThr/pTyr-binding forkhead associated (FHA) protein